MNRAFAAMWAVIVSGLLATAVVAQSPPSSAYLPSARNGLDEQLARLSARIDRHLARGEISRAVGIDARREIDDLQAEVSDDRLRNGGQLEEAVRFRLQDRISRLKAKIDEQLAVARKPPA